MCRGCHVRLTNDSTMKLTLAAYSQADFRHNTCFSDCDDRLGVRSFILANFLLSIPISIATPAISMLDLRYLRPWG